MMLTKVFKRFGNKIGSDVRSFFTARHFSGEDFTLLANDCTGAVLLNRLGMRFMTPTVNLYFPNLLEFLLFADKIAEYSKLPLEEYSQRKHPWPFGVLHGSEGDVVVGLMHYRSFVEGKAKWEMRSDRILLDRIVVVLNLYKLPELEILNRFKRLKCRKLLITYPEFMSTYDREINAACPNVLVIDGSAERCNAPHYSGCLGKRWIDTVDYLGFFCNLDRSATGKSR